MDQEEKGQMDNWKSIFIDNPSLLPEEGIIALEPAIVDHRGTIQEIANVPMKSAYIIHSKKGTVRANHWHKTDWHFCYVLSGHIRYYSRPHDTNEPLKELVVQQGQMVYTPPLVDHAMHFPEETTFLVLSRNARDYDSYESDVERIMVVDPSDFQ
jgi:oxalate decarboxylase/phosphoglucose isomerase-like protein (cupin superfamily)